MMSAGEASCSTSKEEEGRCQASHSRQQSLSLQKAAELVQEVVLPILVVVLGVGFSLAALYVSLSSAIWPDSSLKPDRN